jgi:hypothetical protein
MAYRAGNIHHIRPQSRGGGSSDEVEIDIKLHEAWHSLFNNDLLEEVFTKLTLPCWRNKDGSLNTKFLSEKMDRAWKLLFGNASCDEAVEIIKHMFVERDSRYLFRDVGNKKRRISGRKKGDVSK